MLSVEHSPLSPSQKAARPYLLGGRVGILVRKQQLSQQSLEESDHGFSSGFTGHCLTLRQSGLSFSSADLARCSVLRNRHTGHAVDRYCVPL